MIPTVGEDGGPFLVLGIDIPKHKGVDHRAVLDAIVLGPAIRKTTNVEGRNVSNPHYRVRFEH